MNSTYRGLVVAAAVAVSAAGNVVEGQGRAQGRTPPPQTAGQPALTQQQRDQLRALREKQAEERRALAEKHRAALAQIVPQAVGRPPMGPPGVQGPRGVRRGPPAFANGRGPQRGIGQRGQGPAGGMRQAPPPQRRGPVVQPQHRGDPRGPALQRGVMIPPSGGMQPPRGGMPGMGPGGPPMQRRMGPPPQAGDRREPPRGGRRGGGDQ